MPKGISRIYVEEPLVKGAMFLSMAGEQQATNYQAASETFEIYLPDLGAVNVTVEAPAKVATRFKAKTPILLKNPYFKVTHTMKGAEGKRRTELNYELHCDGFEMKEDK